MSQISVHDRYLGGTPASLEQAQRTAATAPASPQKKSSTATRAEGDQVQLSSLAQGLEKALAADSPERTARLERLSADIRAGRYHPDAQAVSQRIVADALKAKHE